MRIVVDTNRILVALISDGLSRAIIVSSEIEFFTVGHVLEEVEKYKTEISAKSGLSVGELNSLIGNFMQNITLISDEKTSCHMDESMRIMGKIDPKDAPIMACAMAFSNDGIWTEDKHFDRQNKVRVWKSKDLLKEI